MSETGEVDLNLNFKLGERTEVFRSCSVNFNGEMLIFGGDRQRQQVRKFRTIYFRKLKNSVIEIALLNSKLDRVVINHLNWNSCA